MTNGDVRSEAPRLSFRDPSGRLCRVNGRILRLLEPEAAASIRELLESPEIRAEVDRGHVVASRFLGAPELEQLASGSVAPAIFENARAGCIIEHDRIPFPSYPHEWPPEMLASAAELTLDLVLRLLPHDTGLKDATPQNVLFRGPDPIFVDVLSFERRAPGDQIWLPYAQFIRTFLLPLLLNRRFGIPLDQIFLTRRDGIEPDEARRLFGRVARLLPPVLTLVSLPAGLSSRAEQSGQLYDKSTVDPERGRFVLGRILSNVRRTLESVQPERRESGWSGYPESRTHYSEEDLQAKTRFVEASLEMSRPERVLDAGCNTGQFSEMAARHGAAVVAIDADPVVVGMLWRKARDEHLNILPLVVNLARPTPSVGWRNAEADSFLERATGSFDLVMMLALLHHLFVTERIPLAEIVSLAAALTRRTLLIEYIGPADPMFRRLARGRDALYAGLTREQFEEACRRHFDIARVERLPQSERWLYLLYKPRPA